MHVHDKIILLMLKKLAKLLLQQSLIISTAESCTGGLVSSMLTDISGSSAFVKMNFVTYSNEAKHEILGVSNKTLVDFGAVSEECAKEMAEGLMLKTGCDVALCTTGIAGPTGGSEEKPVGLCYIACRFQDETIVRKIIENSHLERGLMKQKFAEHAINLAYEILSNK